MELRHKEVKYDQWAVKRRAELNQSGSRVLTRNLSAVLSLKVEIEKFINFIFHQICLISHGMTSCLTITNKIIGINTVRLTFSIL